MQWIDGKFYPDNLPSVDIKKLLIKGVEKNKVNQRSWVDLPLSEQLNVIFSLVDFWADFFELAAEQSEELFRIGGLLAKKDQLIPSSYDLKLYPVGTVRIKDVKYPDLLKAVLVNWVAGNIVVMEGDYSKESIAGLVILQPFTSAIHFLKPGAAEKVTVDLEITEALLKDNNPIDWVQKVSVLLHADEWKSKDVQSTSGY